MDDIAEILGPSGLLSRVVEGFCYRRQQQEMAQAIADVMHSGGVLIAEAGTGTGKTFAYLIPALISGLKVVISTGTKNLQDQLYHRDLPLIKEILSAPTDIALLKGRSNYLCIHRLENALHEGRLKSQNLANELMHIQRWSGRTKNGDIAEITGIAEDTQIWPIVTSTADNCLGLECPSYQQCHLVEARRRAQEADIVVINHHLLCADFSLKEGGFGELLPAADCFIVDEAHQLPDVASDFFGISVSGRQLLELAKDTEAEYHAEAGDVKEILEQTSLLDKAATDLRLLFGLEVRRGPWAEISNSKQITCGLQQVREELAQLAEMLEKIKERGKGLNSCYERCKLLGETIKIICDEDDQENIRWFETYRQSFKLNRTPLEIAHLFQERMKQHQASWIFTSATLAIGDSFTHFQYRLGLEEAMTNQWESPFDYPHQALWFVPKGLPDPRSDNYTQAVVEISIQVLEASRGRAFLLFTSYRALRSAAESLTGQVDYPLLVQGSAPKNELLERFRSLGNGVLLGTTSFWEGVDVRGEALSCVIIDKLPFASPGDPVLQARIDAVRKRGGNPFMEFQLPQAAIALKQGAGRLIRDVSDRGLLVICDPRLLKRQYGHVFLNSMPPMARTRDMADVQSFFRTKYQEVATD